MTTATKYQPVTPEIVARLREIFGDSNVIYDEPERMLDYAHDEVHGEEYAHMPDVIVKPSSVDEVSALMLLANEAMIPVTPRGAGSGLSGGAVPVYGGILVSFERMNHIIEIDHQNMTITVEPGVITNEINEAIKEYGLFYAGYPMSTETCFIGGNLAENAGGGRAIKYGVTGRYVLGVEVVLPTGEILQLGGKRLKDVTGYDLIHLLVGSEGTLGLFTQATLRLVPLPASRVVLLIPFADVSSAIAAVPKMMIEGRLIPTSIEFMDQFSIQTVYKFLEERPPRPNIGAMLLIEVDGPNEAQVEAMYEPIIDLCLDLGALDVYVGNTEANEERMWRVRRNLPEALAAIYPDRCVEDVVVPLGQIPKLVPYLEELSEIYDVFIPCYGHAGDGNLHASVIRKSEMPADTWHETLPQVLQKLYAVVADLGGTISGEHGIGHKRAKYLGTVLSSDTIALQKRIKAAFDPNQILNPGKIFV